MSKMDQIAAGGSMPAPDGASLRAVIPALDRGVQPARDEMPEVSEAPPPATSRAPDAAKPEVSMQENPSLHKRRRLRMLLMVGGILLVVAAGGITWLRSGRYVSTDDAYVRAAKLMVSTDVSGLVSSVDVREGQTVKAGDVLFRIDPNQFQIALDSAKANLAQTALTIESMKQDYKRMLSDVTTQNAQVSLDQATYDRYATLTRTDSISRANFDQARYTLEADKSKLQSLQKQAEVQLARLNGNPEIPATEHPQYLQVKAQVDEAQRQLDHTVVRAPFAGVVTQVDSLQPGTYLVSQTAALTNTGAVGLVSADNVWVDANIKETDLTNVKLGDPVDVSVDTYPGRVWRGTVNSIAPASGAEFSILPAQNASGNWVKVVQRIPVRIHIDRDSGGMPLRSGMSVTVDIDTRHDNAKS